MENKYEPIAVPQQAIPQQAIPQQAVPQQAVPQPQYVTLQQPVLQQQPAAPVDYRLASRGVQPGGIYENERYCGTFSVLIGIFLLPCICCCPIDERETYTEPGTGRKVILQRN